VGGGKKKIGGVAMKWVPEKAERESTLPNIEGKKGESLFYEPLLWSYPGAVNIMSERYAEYLRVVSQDGEERLIVLVSAMSMEEALDLFLGAYIPDYLRLKNQRDFTPFLKIQLACSLRIIPAHILDAAVLINEIRNKFAHKLKISLLNTLGSGTQDNLRQKYSVFFPSGTTANLSFVDMFTEITNCVILSFEFYAASLKIAREYIYSEDFIDELNKRTEGKSK
jgi:hypothetical protein